MFFEYKRSALDARPFAFRALICPGHARDVVGDAERLLRYSMILKKSRHAGVPLSTRSKR